MEKVVERMLEGCQVAAMAVGQRKRFVWSRCYGTRAIVHQFFLKTKINSEVSNIFF